MFIRTDNQLNAWPIVICTFEYSDEYDNFSKKTEVIYIQKSANISCYYYQDQEFDLIKL